MFCCGFDSILTHPSPNMTQSSHHVILFCIVSSYLLINLLPGNIEQFKAAMAAVWAASVEMQRLQSIWSGWMLFCAFWALYKRDVALQIYSPIASPFNWYFLDLQHFKPFTGLGFNPFTHQKLQQYCSRCVIRFALLQTITKITVEGFLTTKFALMLKKIILK